MERIRVFFIGGLSNGKIVYDYLKQNKFVDFCGAITYKDDYSGPCCEIIGDSSEIIKSGTVRGYENVIRESKPDLIMIAGWSELLPQDVLSIPNMGCVGFHPAKLPMDRGRSVLAWQIEDGYSETALTMFKYVDYPDGGDILAQELIRIEDNDYISDVLKKIDKATKNIIKAYFPLLRRGLIQAQKQDLSKGNFRRLRNDEDSLIDWNQNSQVIYNKIRAISHPYPGAITEIDGIKMHVWRAEIVESLPFGKDLLSGTLVAKLYDGSLIVKTRDTFIKISNYTIDNRNE